MPFGGTEVSVIVTEMPIIFTTEKSVLSESELEKILLI